MGRGLLELLAASADLRPVAAWVSADSLWLGEPVSSCADTISYALPGVVGEKPAVVVDFSNAAGLAKVLPWCQTHGVALVSGSTGLTEGTHAALADAGRDIPVLWSANFSLGIAVLKRALAIAARALPDWDAEVFEAHHSGKRDAPSGTARALAQALAEARGQQLEQCAVYDRHGTDHPRRTGEIGFSVVRAGDIVGEHSVWLASPGERLEFAHRAGDRLVFARGAVYAARWLARCPPGLYGFEDCLG